jgi:hypothetical protein
MRKNPVFAAISRELDGAGIRYVRVHRGKHLSVVFHLNGRRRCIIYSASSSDKRSGLNARGYVRRMLRFEAAQAAGAVS